MEDRCLLAAFVVDTVVDESDGNMSAGDLSLREAIEAANAQSGADTITFSPSVFGTAKTIDLVLGEFVITDDLTIAGPGRDLLTIDAQQNSRHFNIDDGDEDHEIPVAISDLTLVNGFETDGNLNQTPISEAGGSVFSDESIRLTRVTITDSQTMAFGGAIFTSGTAVINDSRMESNVATIGGGGAVYNGGVLTIATTELVGNTASSGGGGGLFNFTGGTVEVLDTSVTLNRASGGGGISNSNGGTMTVRNALIHGNMAGGGGGINNLGIMTIENTTVSGNAVSGEGGGISFGFQKPEMLIVNSTIANNTGGTGAGISYSSPINMVNSIVAGNVDGDAAARDLETKEFLFGGVITGSHNLIGDPGTSGDLTHGTNGNIVGQSDGNGGRELLDIATVLDPLADNGGPTQTHALLPGSPAIDAGDPDFDPASFNPPLTTDQRGSGFDRVLNGDQDLVPRIDIGAVEFSTAANLVVSAADREFEVAEGDSRNVSVRLSKAPSANVQVDVTVQQPPIVSTDVTTLTFTPANWNQIQTIAVSAIADGHETGDRQTSVSLLVDATASDDAFDNAGGEITVMFLDTESRIPLPNITAPTGRIEEQRPTITWTETPGAESYELWLGLIGGDGAVANPTVTGTMFTLTEDLGIGRYRAWVRANLPGGEKTEWTSDVFQVSRVTTLNPLPIRGTETRPAITWPSVPGATEYRVFVSNVTAQTTVTDTRVMSTSYTPATPLSFGKHRIWVQAIGTGNYFAAWSAVMNYEVAPELLNPQTAGFDTQPTFAWTTVPGVQRYRLFVRGGSGVVVDRSDITSTSFVPTTQLSPGTYRWWILPIHANGRNGSWTDVGEKHIDGSDCRKMELVGAGEGFFRNCGTMECSANNGHEWSSRYFKPCRFNGRSHSGDCMDTGHRSDSLCLSAGQSDDGCQQSHSRRQRQWQQFYRGSGVVAR